MRKPPSTFVSLAAGGTTKGPSLRLNRNPLPLYLRFVMVGTCWETLDALDQLDDTPKDSERVVVAEKRGDIGRMHAFGNKKVTGWYDTITYDLIQPQPEQDTLRDTERWRAWVLERMQSVRREHTHTKGPR